MSLSSEIIDNSPDKTDTIDRAKSKLRKDLEMESGKDETEDNGASESNTQQEQHVPDDDVLQVSIENDQNDQSNASHIEVGSVESSIKDEENSRATDAPEANTEVSVEETVNTGNSEEISLPNSNVPNVEEESAGKSDGEIDKKASSQPANSQPEETVLPPVSAATSPDVLPLPLKASSSSEASNSAATPVETENCEGATATCSTASSPSSDKAPAQSVYHVKWIKFKSSTVAIITQNENGPCPLLAIMNFLLLKGKIKLPGMIEMVTSGQLMEYLGDCIFENAPKGITEDAQLNYEQNMHDAMAVFHKLQTGLDVNVKFTGVNDFEYTSECIVFDLLNVPLYHGWLTDPESPEVVAAIGSCSYNQLVEKIISQKNSKKEELMTEALICEEFLERTASQLTYHGLSELVTSVKEDELCVFFRNNHFSTLYKHKNELFLLVTDQGFLTEGNVVWETLCNVEGDGHFVDADFHTYRKPEASTAPIAAPTVPVGTDQQIDQDYLVALSLQEEAPQTDMAMSWPSHSQTAPQLSDHELALQLQEEENRRAAAAGAPASQQNPRQPAHRTQSAPVGGSSSQKKKDKDCVIL